MAYLSVLLKLTLSLTFTQMDAFNEKKWFVYVGEKHEGPFSLHEIQGKMAQGQVSRTSFVWCEGMQDWKAMTEVSEFAPLLQSSEPAAEIPIEAAISISPSAESEGDTGKLDPKAAKKAAKEAEKAAKAASKARAKEGKVGKSRVSSLLVAFLILIVVPVVLAIGYMGGMLEPLMKNPGLKAAADAASDAIHPQMMNLAEKFPALAPYISPIPRLEDVTPEDFEELKAAARDSHDGTQKFALALSTGDVLTPVFYVTTSAADAKQVRVVVTGVGDTLLNHTSFENSAVVNFEKHLGKTAPIRFPDGKPLPRGEYIVSVYEFVAAPPAPPAQPPVGQPVAPPPGQPSQPGQPVAPPPGQPEQPQVAGTPPAGTPPAVQPPATEAPAVPKGRLYTKKQYFLGGAKDATYTERLKEFHERLKGKAASELAEVKQFSATLEMQLNSTIAAFAKFRGKNPKKITKAQIKGWNDLHARWTQLDSQLSQTFQKWSPDTISKDYFYFRLYQLTQETGQAVASLHALQNGYFAGTSTPGQFENELLQTQTLAQASLNLLKAKIEQAEKMPPSPRGLPRREGL